MNSKKKKLEAAIDALFSTPQAQSTKSKVEQPPTNSEVEPDRAEGKEQVEPVPVQEVKVEPVVIEAPTPAPVTPAASPVETILPVETKTPNPVQVETTPAPPAQPAASSAGKPEVPTASGLLTQSGAIQLVIFTLEEQYYGIKIESVESIIKVQAITKLPHVPNYILGLTNLRGKVLPVFNLRRRFGLPDQEGNKNNRIIVIRLEREEAGLMVDSVSEVETIPQENLEPAPSMTTTISARYITGVAKLADRLIILLDLEKVITTNL